MTQVSGFKTTGKRMVDSRFRGKSVYNSSKSLISPITQL